MNPEDLQRDLTQQEVETAALGTLHESNRRAGESNEDWSFRQELMKKNGVNPESAMKAAIKPGIPIEKINTNITANLQEDKVAQPDVARSAVLVKEFDDKGFKVMAAEAQQSGDYSKVDNIRKQIAQALMKQPDFALKFPNFNRPDPLLDGRIAKEVDAILNDSSYTNEVRRMLEQATNPENRVADFNREELKKKYLDATAEARKLKAERDNLQTELGELQDEFDRRFNEARLHNIPNSDADKIAKISANQASFELAKEKVASLRAHRSNLEESLRAAEHPPRAYDPYTRMPLDNQIDHELVNQLRGELRQAIGSEQDALGEVEAYARLVNEGQQATQRMTQVEQRIKEIKRLLPKAETDYDTAQTKAVDAEETYTIARLDRVNAEGEWKERQIHMMERALSAYQLQRRTDNITDQRKRIAEQDKETSDTNLRNARKVLSERYETLIEGRRWSFFGKQFGKKIEYYESKKIQRNRALPGGGSVSENVTQSRVDFEYLYNKGDSKYLEYFLETAVGLPKDQIKNMLSDQRLESQLTDFKNLALGRLIDAATGDNAINKNELRVLKDQPWFQQRVIEAAKSSPATSSMTEVEIRSHFEAKTPTGKANVDLLMALLRMIAGIASTS